MYETAKTDLEMYGYAMIPGVFGQVECDLIREEAYRLQAIPRAQSNMQWKLNGKRRSPGLLFWPQDLSPYMRDVAFDPRLRNIVTSFLGPDVLQLNNQVYYRESGDGDEFAWHQDICFRTPREDFKGIESAYLQTIIVVDRITHDNGAVEFIPGSHKWGEVKDLVPRDNTEYGLREFRRGSYKGVKLIANPGDVLLWSVMAVHGSEQNNSGEHRMTYMNGFAAANAVKPGKFPVYTKDGKPL